MMFVALLKNLKYLFRRPLLTWYKLTFWGIITTIAAFATMYITNGMMNPLAVIIMVIWFMYLVILCGLKPFIYANVRGSKEYEEVLDKERYELLDYDSYMADKKKRKDKVKEDAKKKKVVKEHVSFFFKNLW